MAVRAAYFRVLASSILVKRLYDALANERQRLTATIQCLAGRRADPTFGNAVLLDVGVLGSIATTRCNPPYALV